MKYNEEAKHREEIEDVRHGTFWNTLLAVFVIGKLFGVIHWSWLWVLCPLWLPILVGCIIIALVAVLSD